MKKVVSALCGCFIGACSYGQSITVYQDTIVCSNDTITLYALVDGSYGTDEYTVQEVPYSPEPIGGISMTMTDDTYLGPYSIGFDFCFFGEIYTQFYICSNGWISFVTPVAGWSTNWTPDGPIPSAVSNVPKTAVMGPWTDWHTGLCTNCIYRETVGVAPNRKTIITFEEVPLFSCTTYEGTFQFVLHETTNLVENHLWEVDVCPAWDLGIATQGIHNQTGTVAYTVPGRNATDWAATDESWQYVPSSITWYDAGTGLVVGTGDSIDVSPDVTTTYVAEVTLCDGSTYTDSATVTIAAPFDIDSSVQQIACFGDDNGSVGLTVTGASGPITYSWSSGETTSGISGLSPGIYTVAVEEEGGCVVNLEFEITEPPLLELNLAEYQDITCFDGNDGYINMDPEGGTPVYTFFLNGSAGSDSNFVNLEAGDYEIIVQDMNGCTASFEQTLTQPVELEVDAGNNINIPFGGSGNINATTNSTGTVTVSWLPTEGLSCADCLDPDASPSFTTTYIITVTDEAGCVATDEITIQVILDFTVPNAFTPNGDGVNDWFGISADFLESVTLDIYNRWGDLVFHADDQNTRWDGLLNGVEQEIGTYIFKVNAVTITGTELIKTGTVTLLR